MNRSEISAPSKPCGIFAGLLPPLVAVAEGVIGEIAGDLWPEEQAHVVRAIDSRRAEFAGGRILARRALATLGGPNAPIMAGKDRAPSWPAGFVGSITHSKRYVAAVVAHVADVASLGVDIEEVARFRPELEEKILVPSEAANLRDLAPGARQAMATVIFSVKEAFYKCQHPLSRAWLGFHDAEVEIDADAFRLTLLSSAPPFEAGQVFPGRFRLADGHAAAALYLPPVR